MNTRLVVRLVFLCLCLASCSLPGIEKTAITETPTKEIIAKLPTSTVRPENTKETPKTDTAVPQLTPELSPIPSPTPPPGIWYIVQPGTPLATFNTVHEAAGCSWLGVGGQVFGTDSSPVLGLSILAGGTLGVYQVGSLGTTGMETNIGEGGYVITLADHPEDSKGTLWIRVVDETGNPLSDKISFDTVNDCDHNFILINFIRYISPLPQGSGWTAYLPILVNRVNITATPTP